MGNVISSRFAPDTDALRMSNGLTSVVLDVLTIAACDLAASTWETALAFWFAEHDQARVGLGMADIDVADMGWTRARFEDQKRFALNVIDWAMAGEGWERLPFEPSGEKVVDALTRMRALVVALPIDAADGEVDWAPGEQPTHGICEAHRVFLHDLGCIICNDAPVEMRRALAPNRRA